MYSCESCSSSANLACSATSIDAHRLFSYQNTPWCLTKSWIRLVPAKFLNSLSRANSTVESVHCDQILGPSNHENFLEWWLSLNQQQNIRNQAFYCYLHIQHALLALLPTDAKKKYPHFRAVLGRKKTEKKMRRGKNKDTSLNCIENLKFYSVLIMVRKMVKFSGWSESPAEIRSLRKSPSNRDMTGKREDLSFWVGGRIRSAWSWEMQGERLK